MENTFELGPIQKEWITQLRAHPERQYKAQLGVMVNGEMRMCCLGQAFCILNKDKDISSLLINDSLYDDSEFLLLSKETYESLGLKGDNAPFDGDLCVSLISEENQNGIDCRNLACLNDNGFTWPQIADFIEQNASKIFTKSV